MEKEGVLLKSKVNFENIDYVTCLARADDFYNGLVAIYFFDPSSVHHDKILNFGLNKEVSSAYINETFSTIAVDTNSNSGLALLKTFKPNLELTPRIITNFFVFINTRTGISASHHSSFTNQDFKLWFGEFTAFPKYSKYISK